MQTAELIGLLKKGLRRYAGWERQPDFLRQFSRLSAHAPQASRELTALVDEFGLFAPGCRVLELLCGAGQNAGRLGSKADRYLGMDGSDALVTLAQRNHGNKRIVFRTLSEAALDQIGSDSFDVVFLIGRSGEFSIRTIAALLPRIPRLLAAGGTLAISFPHPLSDLKAVGMDEPAEMRGLGLESMKLLERRYEGGKAYSLLIGGKR